MQERKVPLPSKRNQLGAIRMQMDANGMDMVWMQIVKCSDTEHTWHLMIVAFNFHISDNIHIYMLSSKCIPCALRNGSCTEVSRAMLGFFLSLLMDSCGPTRLPSMPMLWPMDRQASVKSIETRTDSAAYHRLPSGANEIGSTPSHFYSFLPVTFGHHIW